MSDDDAILSEEDKALFRQTMQSVTPLRTQTLRQSHTPRTLPTPQRKPPAAKAQVEPDAPGTDYDLSNHYTHPVDANSALAFSRTEIPYKRRQQLKTGLIPYEARLDLHGLQLDVARQTLCTFIEQQMRHEHRCILIIHGKGGRFGEEPILKNHVNHWLQQLPQVLAFHSALAKHGGRGAVYVLLKKHR